MPEQVQNILNKITEWWKKFNTKQKALLISIVAVIIVALAILAAAVFCARSVLMRQRSSLRMWCWSLDFPVS